MKLSAIHSGKFMDASNGSNSECFLFFEGQVLMIFFLDPFFQLDSAINESLMELEVSFFSETAIDKKVTATLLLIFVRRFTSCVPKN